MTWLLTSLVGTAAESPSLGTADEVLSGAAASEHVSAQRSSGPREAAGATASTGERARHGARARAAKDGAKTAASDANGEVESEIVVEGKPEPKQQIQCVAQTTTGSRLRKTTCVRAADQEAADKAQEQQARDYLRRMSERGTLAPAQPSPYIQSGLPGL